MHYHDNCHYHKCAKMIIVRVPDCSATAEHLHHHYHPPPPPSQTPSQPLLPSTSSEIVEVVDTEEPAPQQDFTLDLSPNSRAGRLAIRHLLPAKYSCFFLDFLDKVFSTGRNTLSKQQVVNVKMIKKNAIFHCSSGEGRG